jgi:cysteine desulfurase
MIRAVRPIYLDNHATTQTDPFVVKVMLPYFTELYGNPGSRHQFGVEASEAVATARRKVASLIKAKDSEIIFTSGATESNNLVLKGIASAYRRFPSQFTPHIITAVTEHKAVLDPCVSLSKLGCRITFLPVDKYGFVSPEQIESQICKDTILVSVMAANNEIGTLQPIEAIGKMCTERDVLFHTDAVAAFGRLPLDMDAMGIDFLSASAHKIYGPKGVGALYIRQHRSQPSLDALLEGGGQERGLRSGTLAVANIAGFGAACELCEMPVEAIRLAMLRDRLYRGITDVTDGVFLNGHPTDRLPGNLNMSIDAIDPEAFLMSMPKLAVSSGSACTSAKSAPSHVIKALGVTDELARSVVRFGIGRFNTEADIDFAIAEVNRAVRQVRRMKPKSAGSVAEAHSHE